MNLFALAPAWLYYLLLALLAAGAIEDVWRRRISNLTSALVAILAVVVAIIVGPTVALWQNVALCVLLLALGTFAFSRGMLGGGDIKLLAALGLWVSLAFSLRLLSAVFIAGGVLALLFMATWRIRRTPKLQRELPYALAIGIGAALVFLMARPIPGPAPALPPLPVQQVS